jgi:purine-cytosine permease-like protein
MAGIASYIAFILILLMWGLGWSAVGAVLGTILKMPIKLSFWASLLLGPLGIVYIVFFGIINRKKLLADSQDGFESVLQSAPQANWDPFS